jgi:tRNA(Ile)-lysidine synthase
MKKAWTKFEHHLWNELKKYKLEKEKVLVALSGGPDSMALAHACLKVLGNDKVSIAHFHHGDGENKKFRDQAAEFCKAWSEANELDFSFEKSSKKLNSEADMRETRYEFLQKTAHEKQIKVIMTAHHAEDVLETRLMRLSRGTGPQGLRAIRTFRAPFFRPFLKISRQEIELYIDKENLKSLTDPSNKDSHYLRNWMRQIWLPMLEEKRPGAKKVLAQSFDSIVEALSRQESQVASDKLSRGEFLSLAEGEQKRCLAAILLHVGQKNFTQFHLEEIRRRVVESPKNNSFKVAGCRWQINAQQIQVQLAL